MCFYYKNKDLGCKYNESRAKNQACLYFSEAHLILLKYNESRARNQKKANPDEVRFYYKLMSQLNTRFDRCFFRGVQDAQVFQDEEATLCVTV